MEINQDIISEIKCMPDDDPKIKEFLIWLVKFERDHLDRERPDYKAAILRKVDEIIRSEDVQKND